MSRIVYIFLFLLVCTSHGVAQRHKRFTYLGVEVGSKSGFFKVTDNGTELYSNRNFQNPIRGIFLEQELDYIWSVSTGLYFSKQTIDFRFRRDGAYSIYEPIRLIQVPLQVRANIPLTYGTPEIRLVPLVGIHFLYNQSKDQNQIKGRIPPDLSDYYTGTLRRNLNNSFILAEGGLNLDLMFAKGLILSFGASYNKGFKKMLQADVDYSIAKIHYQGYTYSNGDNINLHIALKYPVSRFWRKNYKKKS